MPTGQVLGQVVTQMLEPETNDNVVYWNTMDAWIPKARLTEDEPGGRQGGEEEPPLVPIFKLMTPTPLSAEMIN